MGAGSRAVVTNPDGSDGFNAGSQHGGSVVGGGGSNSSDGD